MKRLAAVLLLALLLAACDSGVLPTSTTEGTGTTEAPTTTVEQTTTTAAETTTTAAPSDTTPPDEEATDTPWWLLILIGLALILLIVVFTRRGSKQAAAPPPAVTWKTHVRQAYAEARWLYDAMGEDIAVWRGNATFEGTTDVGSTAATSKAETWAELQRRQAQALDSLYALEASPPDNQSAEIARATIRTLRDTRAAVDARAEARFAYRKADTDGADPSDLMDARDREVRASRNLADARNSYARALTDLSTLV